MRRSSEYWKKRFEQLAAVQQELSEKYSEDLKREFDKALMSIQEDIEVYYQRFADNNAVSMSKAKEFLTSDEVRELLMEVFEYIELAEENALNQQWIKQLENISTRVHISRLESIKLQIQQQVEILYGRYSADFENLARNIYTNGYYHTAYEIQRGFNVGWSFSPIDTNRISKVISKPWAADGQNFSSRIWSNKTKLVNSLHTNLTQSLIRGDSPDKAIKAIAKEFNVSKYNAGRLVMTESAFFASASQKDCFENLDVDRYEIVATLDSHTSTICQHLDGKVFEMKDFAVGITAPPFHPYCRTTTVPYFDDDFGDRAARDSKGKTYYVPTNMNYKSWKEKYVS